ncbi:MAG: LemA family protein [Lentimicrobium sp.]|jgi:LemA protein|nr:LemA family protein [Lentimicrobium sp.]MDD2527164.1 LemA family protein [Lentimicrobiaceae bacterium]MDD4596662.1 LemA family protein [Lentimicrobiaceae bacterium]MDY0025868.1 LemA family protein [Lentimicrobium sp.]
MKKSLIVILVIVGIVLLLVLSLSGRYNKLVTQEETVTAAWSQVENVYQRRADLIPNLVNTVKGYADFEKGTLTAVIEARAKATSTTIDPGNLSEASLEQFQQAQQGLGSALSRLMVVIERYPDLKANQNFLDLQAQLEGTENRIAVERRAFNETAQAYNTTIRRFPDNIIAGLFGFDKKAYFKSDTGAENAPEVNFEMN